MDRSHIALASVVGFHLCLLIGVTIFYDQEGRAVPSYFSRPCDFVCDRSDGRGDVQDRIRIGTGSLYTP